MSLVPEWQLAPASALQSAMEGGYRSIVPDSHYVQPFRKTRSHDHSALSFRGGLAQGCSSNISEYRFIFFLFPYFLLRTLLLTVPLVAGSDTRRVMTPPNLRLPNTDISAFEFSLQSYRYGPICTGLAYQEVLPIWSPEPWLVFMFLGTKCLRWLNLLHGCGKNPIL